MNQSVPHALSSSNPPTRNTFSMRTGVARLRSLPPSVQLDIAVQQLNHDVLTAPILHEVLHHTCANSAVNIALQYRWLELLRLTLSSTWFGFYVYEELIDLAADLAAAEAVLQPLAEGIAHFAEFDCAAPNSKIWTGDNGAPLDCLWWRLLGLKANVGSHIDDMFRQLQLEQLDARMIARKKDVLCNPWHPSTGNDCYLLGYLVIKSLWNKFADGRPIPPLRPAGFLDFLTSYFYEDWGISEILMSPGRISVEGMLNRVVSRLRSLFESDIESKAVAYTNDMKLRREERGLLQRGPEELEHGPFEGLDLTRDELIAGIWATESFFAQRVGVAGVLAPKHGTLEGLEILDPILLTSPLPPTDPSVADFIKRNNVPNGYEIRTLDFILEIPRRKRPFCYLLDTEVQFRGRGGRELILSIAGDAGSERIVSTPKASELPETPQTGRLVSVLASTDCPFRLYSYLMLADMPLVSWQHGDYTGTQTELYNVERLSIWERQMEAWTDHTFEKLNDYFTSDALAGDRVRTNADDATRAMALHLRGMLHRTGWEGLAGKPDRYDFGLRRILPSMKDVSSLAAVGLCNALVTGRPEMEQLMYETGHSLSDVIAMSTKVKREVGVTLIQMQDDHIVAQV